MMPMGRWELAEKEAAADAGPLRPHPATLRRDVGAVAEKGA